MTRQEGARIMKMLRAAYPNFDNNANTMDILNLWVWRFKDTDGAVVFDAVGRYIDGNHEYAPTVGQIKAIIAGDNPQMTAVEAWNLVTRALSDSLHDARAQFDALPEAAKRIVGSPQTLHTLAMSSIDGAYFSQFQARFFREFTREAALAREEEHDALDAPEDKKEIEG